jgi:hypothetical protein
MKDLPTDGVIDIRKAMRKTRMEERDKLHLAPDERAQIITGALAEIFGITDAESFVQNPFYWDMVCFSIEMLGAFAISSEDDHTRTLARSLSQQIYSIHYSVPDGHEILGPERDTHSAQWEDTQAQTQLNLNKDHAPDDPTN